MRAKRTTCCVSLLAICVVLSPARAAGRVVCTWGNATYVDLEVGQSHRCGNAIVKLISIENNFCTVEVNDARRQLIVARRALPDVIEGVRIFVADNRHVADLTATESNRNVHAALTKDALLCLSPADRPLLDPNLYTFPISRADGFNWTMAEDSHMFAYLRPTRSHEGIDLDLSDARGGEIHAILAPEDGVVRAILDTPGSSIEARVFIRSRRDPHLTYSYSHINRNKVFVRPGQEVRKGQKLGHIWGDWRWGHLHFSVRRYGVEPITNYNGFDYLLNTFPQMYELWHGDLEPRPPVRPSGSFKFAGQYWTRGNQQFLDQYDDIVGYGWRLGAWCTASKVETSWPDGPSKPGQSARLHKVMYQNSSRPARNPEDHFDFEVAVPDGYYDVQAQVGDAYAATWQKISFEGADAGVYELDRTLAWTPAKRVRVRDGRLTIRLQLRDEEAWAAIYELHFTRSTE